MSEAAVVCVCWGRGGCAYVRHVMVHACPKAGAAQAYPDEHSGIGDGQPRVYKLGPMRSLQRRCGCA